MNNPSFEFTTLGKVASEANAGRSLNTESPFVSRPVVMLKGPPLLAITNGEKLILSGLKV